MVHYICFAGYNFKKMFFFLSLKIYFVLANSADPDEMHYAAFHVGLHCLQKYPFTFVCLFDLILYVPSTISQLCRDGSSWVEPVLS